MLLISNDNFERLREECELRVVNLGNEMKLFLILAKITYARDRKDKNQHFRKKKVIAVPSGCNLADLKTELDGRQSTLPEITAFFSEMSGFTRSFRSLTFNSQITQSHFETFIMNHSINSKFLLYKIGVLHGEIRIK